MMKYATFALGMAATLSAALSGAACGQSGDLAHLRGAVKIDGSSTVYPITEAVAEEFAETAPDVRVTVGISGTGGGFKRFCVGEIDISNASRPIKKDEMATAKEKSVEYVELPVAYDGLSVVVNNANYWVDHLSIDELKKIYLANSPVKTWRDVRATWPDSAIKIYSPGTDSGTFDYFKEVVAGKDGAIRSDMQVSEDDNVLVRGVSGEEGAIGFFGCAYYFENQDKLKLVPIVSPATGKPVTPTTATIESGEYAPFSRPLFIYVNRKSIDRPEVGAFVEFYLANAPKLVREVGYVKLPTAIYEKVSKNFTSRRIGTQFTDAQGNKVEGSLTSIYK